MEKLRKENELIDIFYNLTSIPSPSLHEEKVVDWVRDFCKKEGLDFNIMVPLLKTYLGHVSIEETYYYYHMLDPGNQTIRKILEETSISRGELLW